MKIIHTKNFPFGNYHTINLFGILFTKKPYLNKITLNHEAIHTAQMKEMLYIGFYLWYGVEYLYVRFKNSTQHESYSDTSFEEESYNNQNNLDYLKTRKHYAWWKYIKANSNATK